MSNTPFTSVPSCIPRHVAIIMDGNGRWAERRGKIRVEGHRAGAKSVRAVVEAAAELKLERLTLFAFSDENWQRPKMEVEAIMLLLTEYIAKEKKELKKNNIRLTIIGDLAKLAPNRQKAIQDTVAYLAGGTGLNLTLAISYSGRAELQRAMTRFAKACEEGLATTSELNANSVREYLDDPTMDDPDLLIRTSGELRLSNFMLWQMAYTELYFTDVLWPDFRSQDFLKALTQFAERDRRYGKLHEMPALEIGRLASPNGTLDA